MKTQRVSTLPTAALEPPVSDRETARKSYSSTASRRHHPYSKGLRNHSLKQDIESAFSISGAEDSQIHRACHTMIACMRFRSKRFCYIMVGAVRISLGIRWEDVSPLVSSNSFRGRVVGWCSLRLLDYLRRGGRRFLGGWRCMRLFRRFWCRQ